MRCWISAIALVVLAGTSAAAQPLEGRLKTINDTGVVRVAYRADADPFSYRSPRGEPTGYSIELCELVVRSLGQQLGGRPLSIQWVPVDTHSRLRVVAEGRADMECGSSTVTLSRMKEVDFSSFIFVESTGLVVRVGSGIHNLNDTGGKKIGVISGTTNEQALRDHLLRRRLNTQLVLVKDREDGMTQLEDGKIDGFASDKLLLTGAKIRNPVVVTMLPEDLSFEPYAIVLPRGDWAFRVAVNTGLAQVYRSGQILQIFEKWFSKVGLRPTLLLSAAFVFGGIPE